MSVNEIEKSCAFTGHREVGDEVDIPMLERCMINLIDQGVVNFYCGMAMGFDLIAADAVLRLKKNYPQIRLIACIPCLGQEKNFEEKDKNNYAKILEKSDDVVVLSENYYNGCMFTRDRYMVDNSKYLIAHLRHTQGGTYYTVSYARNQSREIIVI